MHYGLIWYNSSLGLLKAFLSKYKLSSTSFAGIAGAIITYYAHEFITYKQFESTYGKQVGQMIMVGFKGTNESDIDDTIHAIEEGKLGGVILFGGTEAVARGRSNIINPRQLIILTSYLQSKAGIPLLVATNQEGGHRDNLLEISKSPLPPLVNSFNTPEGDLKKDFVQNGREMLLFGFNTNLAPAIDLPLGTTKNLVTYEQNIERVSRVFIKSYRSAGIRICLKHFPGIRDIRESKDVTLQRLKKQMSLYDKLIEEEQIDMVMVSRDYAAIDSGLPGFMSKKTIDYLRSTSKFEGVILTDSIQAITNFSTAEVIIKAINAGSNIITSSNTRHYNKNLARDIYKIIIKALQKNQIDPKLIEDSYNKIMAVKHRLKDSNQSASERQVFW